MAQAPWISSKKYTGVQYRINGDRKHGATGFDRYYRVRFKIDTRPRVVGLGWASGGWTELKAHLKREDYLEAAKSGKGPASLKEERAIANKEKEVEEEKERKRKLESLPFREFFTNTYLPYQKVKPKRPKSVRSYQREQSLFRLWVDPIIGELPFKSVTTKHLELIMSNMNNEGLSERSRLYAMQLVRQVFNYASDTGMFDGVNPVKKVNKPAPSNNRLRFLTREEADGLLELVGQASQQTCEICLLSLYCGLRAGEIFSLTWGDVDSVNGLLNLRPTNTKNGLSRPVFMPDRVEKVFRAKERGEPNDLVFPARGGGKIHQISDAFNRAVKKLGLNDGITNEAQRVVFHTLRHTHASWHVQAGTDLYVVQKILGHRNLSTTERYSHLDPETFKKAADKFGRLAEPKKEYDLSREEVSQK